MGLGLLTAPAAWLALADYQRGRILTFLDPMRDPDGAGYQVLQSFYALGAGGLSGVGFRGGTQGRLGYLPEHHNDFILATLGEEWGVVGVIGVLALLFGLVAVALHVAERARTPMLSLVAAGLGLQLGAQVVVNAGGVLGMLPLTGVTLPFFLGRRLVCPRDLRQCRTHRRRRPRPAGAPAGRHRAASGGRSAPRGQVSERRQRSTTATAWATPALPTPIIASAASATTAALQS